MRYISPDFFDYFKNISILIVVNNIYILEIGYSYDKSRNLQWIKRGL